MLDVAPTVPEPPFITVEGIDGCGKTTQAALMVDALKRAGYAVLALREPGGVALSEKIRALLLDPAYTEMSDTCELLLYEAARAQLVHERIAPALAAGTVVVCDRFFDSTMVYQGYARGLDLDMLERINAFSCRGLKPDLTILLDIDPELGMKRSLIRAAEGEALENDRFDSETLAFHTAVRNGFLTIASKEPERFRIISASGTIEEVANAVKECVNHEFGLELL